MLFQRFYTRYFLSNSIVFILTVGFSYEDNYCQSQGIGKLIKEKLLEGIFRVYELIKVAANAHYILSVNKGPIRVKIMFENWGCGLNTSL